MDNYCLSLLCSPQTEDRLLDLLLESTGDTLFTSSRAYSHGAPHEILSIEEQVLGRRPMVLVQVLLNKDALEPLISSLAHSFAGLGLTYWATSVAQQGKIK